MVEAAVVAPVLVTLWLTGVYAERACTAKLDAIQAARSQSWGFASSNCGVAGDAGPGAGASGGGSTSGGGGSAAGLVQGLANSAGGGLANVFLGAFASIILDRAFPRSFSSETRTAQGPGNSGYSSTHKAQMAVQCNEAPYNGNVGGFIKQLATMVIR